MSQWERTKSSLWVWTLPRFRETFPLALPRVWFCDFRTAGSNLLPGAACWRERVSDLNAASPRRKHNLCGIVTLSPWSPCDCARVYLLFSRHEKQRESERGRSGRLYGFEDSLILLCVNTMNQLAEDIVAAAGKLGRGGIFALYFLPGNSYFTEFVSLNNICFKLVDLLIQSKHPLCEDLWPP